MYSKEKQKVKHFLLFREGVDKFHYQSRIGKRESFILPDFSLVRISRKDTLNEFETDIKMAPQIDGSFEM